MRSKSVAKLFLAALFVAAPASCLAGIEVSITLAPPALPVYVQPVIPGDGYLWTPGYWAYGPEGYFWVPGTWVLPPRAGLLWTPGYWGFAGGFYGWHVGYWGPHVGFYGGVNYGFGFGGVGFVGGRWEGGRFAYNTAVANVNTTVIHNTYIDKTVVVNNNTTVNRTSFNGGAGGIQAQPSATERAAANEQHVAPTGEQASHEHAASQDRTMLASANHGNPTRAAVSHPIGSAAGPNAQAAHPQAQQQAKAQPQGQGQGKAQAKAQPKAKPAAKPGERPNEEKR